MCSECGGHPLVEVGRSNSETASRRLRVPRPELVFEGGGAGGGGGGLIGPYCGCFLRHFTAAQDAGLGPGCRWHSGSFACSMQFFRLRSLQAIQHMRANVTILYNIQARWPATQGQLPVSTPNVGERVSSIPRACELEHATLIKSLNSGGSCGKGGGSRGGRKRLDGLIMRPAPTFNFHTNFELRRRQSRHSFPAPEGNR